MFSPATRVLRNEAHALLRCRSLRLSLHVPRLAATLTTVQEQGPSPNVASSLTPLEAAPLYKPVYLEVSSLLVPDPNQPPKVAALDPTVFDHPIRNDILHLCVVHHLDSLRQGTASTKTRGEVRGSGAKLRPQKGSGKARVGDAYSPTRRGGGVAFGPKPRDFSTKLPRKVIQMGMRVALSSKVRDRRFGVVESLNWPGVKTKLLAKRIDALGWRKTLFVTGEDLMPPGLARSSSNLAMVESILAKDLNVYTILKWQRVVMDVAAVNWFERTLGNPHVQSRLGV